MKISKKCFVPKIEAAEFQGLTRLEGLDFTSNLLSGGRKMIEVRSEFQYHS